jgi:hypothetical protein
MLRSCYPVHTRPLGSFCIANTNFYFNRNGCYVNNELSNAAADIVLDNKNLVKSYNSISPIPSPSLIGGNDPPGLHQLQRRRHACPSLADESIHKSIQPNIEDSRNVTVILPLHAFVIEGYP